MTEPTVEKKQGFWSKLKGAFSRTPRLQETFDRMHKVGGFIPIFNVDDTEARRAELRLVLSDIEKEFLDIKPSDKDFAEKVKLYKKHTVNKVFALFFCAGSPWYRGLDDRELAGKVQAFLELWNYIGDHDAFVDDMFMCAMQLLNLSWKALDVTNTPPYLIETKTTVMPPESRIKLTDEVREY